MTALEMIGIVALVISIAELALIIALTVRAWQRSEMIDDLRQRIMTEREELATQRARISEHEWKLQEANKDIAEMQYELNDCYRRCDEKITQVMRELVILKQVTRDVVNQVNTSGGTYVGGDATAGRDLAGRDKAEGK